MSLRSSSATSRTQPRAEAASFGELLYRYRTRAGLTQEMLAEQAEVSPAAIAALEQGLRHWPYPHTLKALATALVLSVDEAESLAELARRPRRQPAGRAPPSDAASRPVLPRPLARLVGRAADLTHVQRLLERSPLVTLVGPGGIGKTRLALELGRLSAKQFNDGVAFADLSPIDNPALIASTVAASAGIREQARAPLVRVLSEGLRARRVLLILENCEHLVRDCAGLAQQLLSECPALAILATSREPLAIPGELVWQVAPLELVKAFVVLRPDQIPTDALAAELSEFVKSRLSAHAYPRAVAFVDHLPKTPSGKVQRFLLREPALVHAS